jgi:hypothetical protein
LHKRARCRPKVAHQLIATGTKRREVVLLVHLNGSGAAAIYGLWATQSCARLVGLYIWQSDPPKPSRDLLTSFIYLLSRRDKDCRHIVSFFLPSRFSLGNTTLDNAQLDNLQSYRSRINPCFPRTKSNFIDQRKLRHVQYKLTNRTRLTNLLVDIKSVISHEN